jgi:Glycosyl transferases group 1
MGMPPVRRVAVTTPPDDWFYGIAADLAAIYRAGLTRLGVEVYEVPVEAFFPADPARIDRIADELRAFAPELALGLSHGTYALICRVPHGRRGSLNLFTDLLDLPTVCLWDHAPLDLADQVLGPPPADPSGSERGALAELRRALDHPRVIHWSRDAGQSRLMTELRLAAPERTIATATPALPPYSRSAVAPSAAGAAFVGHVYQEPPQFARPILAGLADETIAAWDGKRQPSLWSVLADRIAALPDDGRRRLHLTPDETFFWGFAHRLILHEAQTHARLAALGATGVTVSCVGNLDPSRPGTPPNLVAASGEVPFQRGLPEALSRYELVVDVLNPGFIEGYSTKVVQGFAAGGFVLADRTAGFVERFGEAGEAATWTDHADLAAKVELYLSRPALRGEVGDAIRDQLVAAHTLDAVLGEVLERAASLRGSRSRSRSRRLMIPRLRHA